jgi:hypothetical protein
LVWTQFLISVCTRESTTFFTMLENESENERRKEGKLKKKKEYKAQKLSISHFACQTFKALFLNPDSSIKDRIQHDVSESATSACQETLDVVGRSIPRLLILLVISSIHTAPTTKEKRGGSNGSFQPPLGSLTCQVCIDLRFQQSDPSTHSPIFR